MVKVSNFGLTEDMYARNYFRRDKSERGSEEKVPIRWIAPESIENDIYNERTDIVGLYIIQGHHNYTLLQLCYILVKVPDHVK